jgi:hypothetical protein
VDRKSLGTTVLDSISDFSFFLTESILHQHSKDELLLLREVMAVVRRLAELLSSIIRE